MPLTTLPLIAWGSADDMSGGSYTASNTTVTGSQADPFGGTSAYQLDDTSAVAEAYVKKNVTPTTTTLAGLWLLRAGTSATTSIRFWDNTASANRFYANVTWSGVTVAASVGTVYGPVALGASWYAFLGVATGVVAGNVHYFLTNPAGLASHTPTGTVFQYVRNGVLLDYLDGAVASSALRAGSQTGQTLSGVEDAWVSGRDYLLTGQQRWVPLAARDTPVTCSGWRGANESTGVNCGVSAMLYAGMGRNVLQFVPDRSACTTYVNAYLQRPASAEDIALEPNGERTYPFQLRSTSEFTGI